MKHLLFLSLSFFFLFGDEAADIVKKLDENLRGSTIYIELTMKVVSSGHERVIKLENYSQGSEKSFVKITYPPRDRGITFLSLDNQMWQYVPKIERVIKIPPSMMLQKWMGSDISNDDIVKQSSLVEDYKPKIINKKENIVTLQLTPKEDAAVVWGKIDLQIDLNTYTSQKDTYYDEDGKIVRFFIYKDVKKYGKYYIPLYWRVEPYEKKGQYTEITLQKVEYDLDIPHEYFQKSALKRFSR
ncbi:outer membrane lipoprotein-sorting protein [Sulfurimonas marina]|uniref:Outer membrane lipoprotein-sorting protein n=1 Tax=Sulfurimonas marina TaxID=2590551 RepID=A0A7M1AZP9_9BACT|nr:outer membrane lipoprotein-sorting protein [Sulfurimonas marina]QOP42018.1 outer membrane lipoprotein-sorting protein [Sulfurimonas marina]